MLLILGSEQCSCEDMGNGIRRKGRRSELCPQGAFSKEPCFGLGALANGRDQARVSALEVPSARKEYV